MGPSLKEKFEVRDGEKEVIGIEGQEYDYEGC